MENEPNLYGYLVVLGSNGKNLNSKPKDERYTNKLVLVKRPKPNGIKPSNVQEEFESPHNSAAYRNSAKYSVSYQHDKKVSVEEYDEDINSDMYQIGRSWDDQIDFVLSSYNNIMRKNQGLNPENETVSRYACRILIERQPPNIARIYAAGFDSNRNIFVGESAVKWRTQNNKIDGFTTNGVLIRYPDDEFHQFHSDKTNKSQEFVTKESRNDWKEISVSGAVYECFTRRGIAKLQYMLPDDSNILIDGTLIDLCGVTLLWRSNKYFDSEVTYDLQSMCDKLNEAHIQCPVEYRTLHMSPKMLSYDTTHRGFSPPKSPIFKFSYKAFFHRKRSTNSSQISKAMSSGDSVEVDTDVKPPQLFVYLECGHVVGNKEWRNLGDSEDSRTCPCCRSRGAILKLRLVQESAFCLDDDIFSYCFSPCGHMGSEATVKYWSNIDFPSTHDTSFTNRCPFCYKVCDKPIKLFFQ